jgi:hypothetical protein
MLRKVNELTVSCLKLISVGLTGNLILKGVTNYMEEGRLEKLIVAHLVNTLFPLRNPKFLTLSSQETLTSPYTESNDSSLYSPPYSFHIYFNIIFETTPASPQ